MLAVWSKATVAFWSAAGGALIGSLFSLIGVWLTLRHENKRDERADARALRDGRALRLRTAFRELSAAASAMEVFSAKIAIAALAFVRGEPGGRETYLKLMGSSFSEDVGQAQASLQLEPDEDRAVLDAFEEAQNAYTAIWTKVATLVSEGESVSADEFKSLMDRLHESVDKIAGIARDRLAALEQPAAEGLEKNFNEP